MEIRIGPRNYAAQYNTDLCKLLIDGLATRARRDHSKIVLFLCVDGNFMANLTRYKINIYVTP